MVGSKEAEFTPIEVNGSRQQIETNTVNTEETAITTRFVTHMIIK